MKTKIKFSRPLKALLVAGLLATPMLAFNAMANDNHWAPSPLVTYTDGNGNQYAYFDDPSNWSLSAVPTNGDGNRTIINGTLGTPGTYVSCFITNSMSDLYQLIMGYDGTVGGGNLIITNGAQVSFGVGSGQWTGVGFPNGPSTLYIGPGCSFTCGSHLWVGQGTNNGNPAQGMVIIDGGTLSIPNGQLGIGWNGTGGTNYITLTNGGRAFLQQWAGQTLGLPGNNSLGIMNLADNASYVVVTNNYANDFATLTNNNQLIAYGGAGTITWNFNPVLHITTIRAVAPFVPGVTPVIAAQPTNVVTSSGGTASFHVQIVNVPVNYQWFFNGNPLSDGGGITGSKTATLTVSGVTPAQVGSYFVMATNTTHADQFVTSSSVSLTTDGINLYPVVTINGVPGSTYAVQYTASLTTPNWITFTTITVNNFGPQYVVDSTSPMAITRFYRVVQQ